MEDWLDLINAETEGELMELNQTTSIPEVKDTIVMLRHLSSDEKIRQEAYYREKRMHDEANALGGARREGYVEGVAEGMLITLASLVKDGLLSPETAAEKAHMSLDEFNSAAGIKR